jgi:hypothetical protein
MTTPSITDIPAQGAQVIGPVFAHAEQIPAGIALQMVDPITKEVTIDVLNGIQTKTICPDGVEHPFAPILEFSPHFGMIDIQVTTHQIVVVASLPDQPCLQSLCL